MEYPKLRYRRSVTSPDDTDRRIWAQVADDLRRQITQGTLVPGDRLRPRRQLMADYGVADRTIARALHQLRDEGHLLARSTAGWFVRDARPVVRSTRSRLSTAERAAGRGTFTSDCHEAGMEPHVSTEVFTAPANEDVAAALGLEPGDEVCVRDRVMRGDDTVLQLATSYLPRTVTVGTAIEQEDTGPGGTYARLEEAGYELTDYTERVSIGRAEPGEARTMAINPGEPVHRITRTARSGDTVVEINRITLPGGRYELVYELPAT